MATSEVIDATTGELVRYEPPSPTLFRTDQPQEIVARATETANALAEVVKKQELYVAISGKNHVKVEGWTLCGTMLGVFPVCVWTRKLDNGWEARVEARTLAGNVIGAAEASCTREEGLWRTRDDYAIRSMAQTRATSKALRQPLGFVMTLAGFDPTPAEEIPRDEPAPAAQPSPFRGPTEQPASEAQVKNIDRLIQKLTKDGVVDAVKLAEGMVREYGTSIPAELSKAQASEFITRLKAKAGEDE